MSRPFFVIGCPRSGTTLVRLMLDSHPRLAVPPESHFIVQGPGPREPVGAALERILAHRRFRDWGLAPEHVEAEIARQQPASYADVVRCLYDAFARDRGKARWGDKTPHYVLHVPRLLELFPDAQIVHVIRDGREVAAAVYAHGWLDSPVTAAAWWRRTVREGRRWRSLGPERYHEVRLERLIEAPEQTLRALCRFLDEPFASQMLDYHHDGLERLPPWVRAHHPHTQRPPVARLREWTSGLSAGERRAVEAVCRRQLLELGLTVPRRSPSGYAIAVRHLARARWRELRHPVQRDGMTAEPPPRLSRTAS